MNFSKMKESAAKRRWMAIFTAIFTIAVLAGAGLFIYESTKKSVAVNFDGNVLEIKTHAKTVEDILEELDITYRSQDMLTPGPETAVTDNLTVHFKTAQQVIVNIDGEKSKLWTTADTVDEFLKEQKININDHDELNVALNDKITSNLEIRLDVAFKTVLNDGGTETEFWTTSTTVADFLEQQGIKLNELDRVEPELEQVLNENSVVNVIRVEKVTDVVEESIDFAVVSKKDNSIENGKEKVVQQGQKGILQKKYEVIMENGKVVSKTLISEEVIQNPIDKVVALGTKAIQPVSRGAETGQEYTVTASAYTPFCNGCSGKTATGIDLRANPNQKIIAVDPSFIPLGTKVWVEGYGYAVAADTGGNIKGYKIDVLFPTKSEAYSWGVRKVKIKILK